MKTRRTARTIVVWIALLLLIASWFYTWLDSECYRLGSPSAPLIYEINWGRLYLIDSTIIALAAGFLFTFRGGNDN
jgi:hypothetical protein